MASRKLEKATWRELKRINDSVPEELLMSLMKKTLIAPTAKALFGKALEDSTITPEQRERFELILSSGVLDREVEIVDFDTEKAIDAYLSAEIALSVKAGRLPKEAPKMDYLISKGKKYARKRTERLKELFDTSEGSGESPGGHDRDDALSDSSREHDGALLSEPGEEAG